MSSAFNDWLAIDLIEDDEVQSNVSVSANGGERTESYPNRSTRKTL
jgi:hypothetical protein